MNQQDQQAIDGLFQHLSQTAAQAGPRDPQAEARIQQHLKQDPQGLIYQMAQTLVGQQAAIRQLRAQLADCQQQSGAPAGFAQPGWRGARPQSYGPPVQQGYGWQRSGSGQGFLAGAGQIALGVGGGILAADALSSLLSGGGLFGGDDRAYEQGFDQGYDQGQDQGYDQGQDQGFDQGQGNDAQPYDDGGYDAGGFDGGGFDDGGGW